MMASSSPSTAGSSYNNNPPPVPFGRHFYNPTPSECECQDKKKTIQRVSWTPENPIHGELRPTLSGSDSSSTVARPSGLSMVAHIWVEREELFLFEQAEKLIGDTQYRRKSNLNRELVRRLTEEFPEVEAPFTEQVLKNKFDVYQKQLLKGYQLKTCNGSLITCSEQLHNFLFIETGSASGSRYSGANASVQPTDSVNNVDQNGCSIGNVVQLLESDESIPNEYKVTLLDVLKEDATAREIFLSFTRDSQFRQMWIMNTVTSKLATQPRKWVEPSLNSAGHEEEEGSAGARRGGRMTAETGNGEHGAYNFP